MFRGDNPFLMTFRVQLGIGNPLPTAFPFSDPESFVAALSKSEQGVPEEAYPDPLQVNPDGSVPPIDVADMAAKRG